MLIAETKLPTIKPFLWCQNSTDIRRPQIDTDYPPRSKLMLECIFVKIHQMSTMKSTTTKMRYTWGKVPAIILRPLHTLRQTNDIFRI
jgi:hypothetical protein